MALNDADIELIRASWCPARKDPVGAGVLLFRGLFTKFPDYLRLFNQFDNLDIERLHENKRLIKHAVKVIETVTFVVDSIGEPTKSDQLSEALVALVRGHLKRKIGLKEFRNLGIVLIDFICDLNNRRDGCAPSTSSSSSNPFRCTSSSVSSSQDSETMTSALDKIRASSSPSSSSEGESLLAQASATLLLGEQVEEEEEEERNSDQRTGVISSSSNAQQQQQQHGNISHLGQQKHVEMHEQQGLRNEGDDGESDTDGHRVKLDTSLLVVAWTKLYGIILDLVKSEEDKEQASQ